MEKEEIRQLIKDVLEGHRELRAKMSPTTQAPRDRALAMRNAIADYLLARGWTLLDPHKIYGWQHPSGARVVCLQSLSTAVELQMRHDLAPVDTQSRFDGMPARASEYPG